MPVPSSLCIKVAIPLRFISDKCKSKIIKGSKIYPLFATSIIKVKLSPIYNPHVGEGSVGEDTCPGPSAL